MDTVERVTAIISYLAAAGGRCGVTEISKKLRLSKSSVYRVLSSLESIQWVSQDAETRKYTSGTKLLELGLSFLSNIDLRRVSQQYLKELRNATGETSMLSLRVGLERMYIEQVPGRHEVQHLIELGRWIPLWCGAVSKAMLAYMEENEVEAVIDNLRESGVTVLASGQAVDIDGLRTQLANIRRQGYAITLGERVAATIGVAAPIFGYNHRVVGAISVSGPLLRFNAELATRYAPLVTQAGFFT